MPPAVPGVNPRQYLAIETGGIAFRNPVLTASGTFGYGKEFERLTDLARARRPGDEGHLARSPASATRTPRICETASGMLNSIGLENVGVEGFERDKLPYLRECGTRVLVNFFGATFDEYVACGAGLDRLDGVDALEMNVSCPNIKAGGIEFGTDPRVLRDLVRACRAVIKKPLWIKLTPNTSDIVALAQAPAPTAAPTGSRSSTRSPGWRSTRARGARRSRRSSAACRARPSSRSRCAWSTRCTAPACRCRSRASAASRTRPTRSSSFWPAPRTVQVGTQSFVDPDASGHIVRDLADAPAPPTGSATCAS